MTDRKLMQQALETLEWHLEKGAWGADIEGVTAALRERLAQPERQRQELNTAEIYAQTDAEMLEFARVLEARLKEKK